MNHLLSCIGYFLAALVVSAVALSLTTFCVIMFQVLRSSL